ncbi:response regulator [Paenibacillus thalictri]|uniref:Response regulator n=1 Tax=Paenibacillus thalictri TaxID=2527873 RepID=A0A4Q9DNM7_9BACL|nr:response regulator [Paenibacillus thalictri]TBL75155.1 response regulator [Paenibacillus thalictri]
MLRLMIVDDHPGQVESMALTVPWREHGIETVCKAYSGGEALAMFEQEPADILITDIRMPGMSGLELIQQVRALSAKTRCILMSGYSDFEYAKQAIQHKTLGYLMKPVDTSELVGLIDQTVAEMHAERNTEERYSSVMYTLREHIPALRANMLKELLQGKQVPPETLQCKMRKLELDLDCGEQVGMMIVRLDEDMQPQEDEETEISPLEYAVTNMAEELLGIEFKLWYGKDPSGYLVFLAAPARKELPVGSGMSRACSGPCVCRSGAGDANAPISAAISGFGNCEPALERLGDCARELQRKVRIYLKRKISMLLIKRWLPLLDPGPQAAWAKRPSSGAAAPSSAPVLDAAVLSSAEGDPARTLTVASAYRQAVHRMRKEMGTEKQIFIVLEDGSETVNVGSLQSLYEPPHLLHMLESGRWEQAERRLESIFTELDAKWRESPEYLSEAFFAIAAAFMHVCHKNGRQLQDLIGRHGAKLQQNRPFYSLNQLRVWTLHVFRTIQDDAAMEQGLSRMPVVERVHGYIERNLDGDTSLQAIADCVGLHPAYLSKLYKLETGVSLSDFVTKARMEKAAQLLRNKHDKVYAVAGKLGYQTPHYFIKVFKKYYGITPQEYKSIQN